MKSFFHILFCLSIILFASCNNHKTSHDSDISAINPTITQLVNDWNTGINKKDMNALTCLYADSVSFYGKTTSKALVIEDKSDFLNKHADFNQKVSAAIAVVKFAENQYKATFRKTSIANGSSNEVEAYLIFKRTGEAWKIVYENDATTERNLSRKNIPAKDDIKNCEDLAEKILWTSPYFKERTKGLDEAIKKNGGDSYGTMLEESPGIVDGDTIDAYGFNLHEMYPDRMVVDERFRYDPKKQKLYRYDIAEDTLIEIDFDRTLLEGYKGLCD